MSGHQLELRLGIGGTSYVDFIHNTHLPEQLRYVAKFEQAIAKLWSPVQL